MRVLVTGGGGGGGFVARGRPRVPQREEGPFNPPELYAISKYAAEQTARRYGELFPLDVRAVRLSGVFGPMERTTGSRKLMSMPYRAAHAVVTGRPLRLTARTLEAGGDFLSARDMDPADRLARWNAYDIGRVRADAGWKPRPLAEQFGEYVEWVRADPDRRCPDLP